MKTINIYFSDLNDKAQKELLKAVGAETPEDMNWSTDWDKDILPIAQFDFEEETGGEF